MHSNNFIPLTTVVDSLNPRVSPTDRDSFEQVRGRSFRIDPDTLPDVRDREHMARPYPGGDFDLLAINVPSTYQQGLIPDGEESPHGLLRIVAAANHLHEQRPLYPRLNAGLLDAHRLRLQPEEIREQLLLTNTRVVGINPTSINVPEAQAIAQICDQEGIPYILGGIHATLDPAIARADFPTAAAIVRGTGELVIAPLVKSIHEGNTPDIKGVFWPGSDHTEVTRTNDIEPGDIPHIDQAVYVEAPVYAHEVSVNGVRRIIKEANLFVTYGCPFECTFCSSPTLVGRNERTGKPSYRRPDMERITDDIEHVVTDLGADAIHFLDDMAFVTQTHIEELHAELLKRGLLGNFIWRGLTRAPVINRFTDDGMLLMRETGAWKIALGVESGSDEVLKRIKKKAKVEDVETAVVRLSKAGIQSKGFFIFGFPGETLAQMQETITLIQKLGEMGMTEISAFQFKPYPGTEAYQQVVEATPGIEDHLNYLRHRQADGKKADARATDTPWLPDDLVIADVPSGEVRKQVLKALQVFYGDLPADALGSTSC
jgi:anaerobic magnesium-protoporphyrin IX monomethyl ester cyclase